MLTKKTLSCHVALLVALFVAGWAHGIVKAPTWTQQLSAPVNWQQMTMSGTLIVATHDGLLGLDTKTGLQVWRHADLRGIKVDGFEEIPGSALVVLTQGQRDKRIIVLDALKGTVVFDSRKENLAQILDKRILHNSSGLLIAGFEVGKPKTTLFLYDISTGKRRWKSDALHSGKGKMIAFLSAIVAATQNISPISSSPVELSDGTFLLAAGGDIYRMGADNGAVVWKTAFPWGSPHLYLSEIHPNRVFVGAGFGGEEYLEGNQSIYHALDLDSGRTLWEKPKTFRGAFNPNVIFADEGLLVSEYTASKGWLRLLDYDSGKSLWGKKGRGLKIKGGVAGHALSGRHMAITTGYDSAWNDEGIEYYFYVVDLIAGKLTFKKPVKIRGELIATRTLPSGVLYATTHEINVLDISSGKKLNPNQLKSKRQIKSVADDHFLYAFAQDSGLLHKLDLRSGLVSTLSGEKVKLKGKDKSRGLEIRADRIVLIGQQSVVAWDKQGSLIFNQYHKAPQRPVVLRALLYAQAARSAARSFASGVYAGGFAQASSHADKGGAEHLVTSELSAGYAQMSQGYGRLVGSYWRAASERFQASKQSRDFVFMMIRQENKRFGLAQVNKDTGNIVGVIDLGKEKQPKYQVDDIGGLVFRQTSASEITAYQY